MRKEERVQACELVGIRILKTTGSYEEEVCSHWGFAVVVLIFDGGGFRPCHFSVREVIDDVRSVAILVREETGEVEVIRFCSRP